MAVVRPASCGCWSCCSIAWPSAAILRAPPPPPPLRLLRSPSPAASSVCIPASSTAASRSDGRSTMSRHVRVAVVGDVHDNWDLEEDAKALHFLGADLVLFTGDFGNENVDLVKSVAKLNLPKAAILGNHDSWHTSQFSKKKTDGVQLQLECLGEQHVGYRRLDFPLLNLSVVGGRPFSCGGKKLFREKLLSERYGVKDMESSARKIFEAAVGAPAGHTLILLAHNGPTGLGDRADDICGRDWVPGGGDHGDPDLAMAIDDLKRGAPRPIPLVVFGHMHKELARGGGLRKMIAVGEGGTVYLNGAVVPRVRPAGEDQKELRGFTVVEAVDGRLRKISETWVLVCGEEAMIAEETVIFEGL
ncbi:unnamed protein product [Spirodela intermedia]|uniref:Calcineurin-like phosphoesterase domain-containing protein n=1 Tax=Spirodela intermedia TaxID=51605 RepID=A0A7I8LB67_SPIIN|nr:unnamed protein product [Spirodela intermedia]